MPDGYDENPNRLQQRDSDARCAGAPQRTQQFFNGAWNRGQTCSLPSNATSANALMFSFFYNHLPHKNRDLKTTLQRGFTDAGRGQIMSNSQERCDGMKPKANSSSALKTVWLESLVKRTEILLQEKESLSRQRQQRNEALAGLKRQLQILQAMHHGGRTGQQNGVITETAQMGKWDALRDCFSLHPSNCAFTDAFRDVSLALWGGDATELIPLRGQPLILHLSCQARVGLSIGSVASFSAWPQLGHHIVVVGGSTQLKFRHQEKNSWLLELPMSDAYETLHSKLFLAITLLWLWLKPIQIIKLDDDLHLHNGDELLTHIRELKHDGIAYGGRMIRSKHRNIHHGWHLGKCKDITTESTGYQFPIGSRYAAGGSGYVLTGEGISEVAYVHLAMRKFLELPCQGMEDGLVGLMIQLSELKSRDCGTLVLPGLIVRTQLSP